MPEKLLIERPLARICGPNSSQPIASTIPRPTIDNRIVQIDIITNSHALRSLVFLERNSLLLLLLSCDLRVRDNALQSS